MSVIIYSANTHPTIFVQPRGLAGFAHNNFLKMESEPGVEAKDGLTESGSALSGERKSPTLCCGGDFLRA